MAARGQHKMCNSDLILLQAIMHPEQDRVLTIRENARLQGFPDYYKLCGPIKERYEILKINLLFLVLSNSNIGL